MKNKTNANLLVSATIICMTLLMFAMNPYCRNTAESYASQQQSAAMELAEKDSAYAYANMNDDFFSVNCGKWVYPLYMEFKADSKLSNGDLIIENMDDLSVEERESINQSLSNKIYEFHENFAGIKYYVLDETTKDDSKIYTNDSTLVSYLDGSYNTQNKDAWFVAFEFDDAGVLSILRSRTSVKSDTIKKALAEERSSIRESVYYASNIGNTNASFITFHNIKFVFAISPDSGLGVNYVNDVQNDYQRTYEAEAVNKLTSVYLFTLVLMALMSWLLTRHTTKESSLCHSLMLIPLEFVFLVFMITFILSVTGIYQHYLLNYDMGSFFIDTCCYIVSYTSILYFAILIQSRKEQGPDAIKSVSLILGDATSLIDKVKNFYHYLNDINFDDESNRRVLLLILFNLLIMLLFGRLGALFFIPYCLILFYIFTTRQKKHRDNFKAVKDITSRISNGEFDEPVDEELGVYEPLKDDLRNIQHGIEEAVAKELTSQRMKNELITNVSHDLKTPLTAIISYIDLLKNTEITEEERESYLATLEKSADRLKHLIEDLFDISKANSGNVSLEYMEVDLISLLKQVEMECRSTLENRELTIKHQFSDEKILLDLDPQKACRIFENLISNAAKYSLEHTRIFITVMDFDTRIDVEIKNVSKEELDFTPEEIVERFTRGDKSRNTEGSGLGLAIAKSFTELMNGNMRIDIDGDVFKVQISFYKHQKEA